MIEVELKRIADALERRNELYASTAAVLTAKYTGESPISEGEETQVIPSKVLQEAVSEVKKGRGRPRKEPETPAAKDPAPKQPEKAKEEPKPPAKTEARTPDDFLDEQPAKPAKPPTLDAVRAALKAYAQKWVNGAQAGTTGARALMGKVSAGAVRLSAQPEIEGGTTGVLPVEHYQQVIDACNAVVEGS